MRQFEDYMRESFDHATGWYRDNGYEGLNKTADELLRFRIPCGLNFSLSSLATPNFATSYHLSAGGQFDGSICYLYSSVPLRNVIAGSDTIPLPILLRSYRQVLELPKVVQHEPTTPPTTPLQRFLRHPSLVFGRLFLPQSMLEALVIKRASPTLQFQLKGISGADLPNGGTILGVAQYNTPQLGVEGLLSTDGGLLGLRGLYNFGGDASASSIAPTNGSNSRLADGYGMIHTPAPRTTGNGDERDRIYGRFSAGGEMYYGVLNKSIGASLGARFATLPAHRGTPLVATMTLNPLMGNISASFAVSGRQVCSLATRFDFNVYSYESDWAVGMELWGKGRMAGLIGAVDEPEETKAAATSTIVQSKERPTRRERSFQAKLEWRLDKEDEQVAVQSLPNPSQISSLNGDDEFSGVLKARMDQHFKIGLLWEGRLKSLIFSLGTSMSLIRPEQSFRSLGLEIQYSS